MYIKYFYYSNIRLNFYLNSYRQKTYRNQYFKEIMGICDV